MKMCIGGNWVESSKKIEVTHPYNGESFETVPHGTAADVDRALEAAARGARTMAKLTAHERAEILHRTARALEARAGELAQTITREEGKVLAEARAEVSRAIQTVVLAAEEAKRIHGETIPLDATPGVTGKLGFTLRVPCGVVAAISPFNFPLNLTAHKVAPAVAAGNAVVIKPPTSTPLSALKLTEALLEAGLPPEAISCVTGPGGEIGDALCKDRRVRKITFTGSVPVGERICRTAGIKKVTMELGSNAPIVVLPDADLDLAATAIAATGYSNAGQVCISTQRVIAHRAIYDDLLEATRPRVEALTAGDPFDERTKVGPLVEAKEAARVEAWIEEALGGGARLITGGRREGPVYLPTLVADVKPEMRISCEELFGPAVAVTPAADIDQAIALCNQSTFGLSAAVFTRNVDNAVRFALEAESGNIHINWGPQWRADIMPYGGLKDSGFGKEGPRYAVEEMTELKMVVFHRSST